MKIRCYLEYLRSWEHAVTAMLTLGLGLAWNTPFSIIAGATLYALGWVFLPDMSVFSKRVDAKDQAKVDRLHESQAKQQQRVISTGYKQLEFKSKARYDFLNGICDEITAALPDINGDAIRELFEKQIPELRQTYLQLLIWEQNLIKALSGSELEQVQSRYTQALAKLNSLPQLSETRIAQEEIVGTLKSQIDQLTSAQEKIEHVHAEQLRIEEQVRLLKTSILTSGPTSLQTQVNRTVDILSATKNILKDAN